MNLHVVSTGFASPTEAICRLSVQKQVVRLKGGSQLTVKHHVRDAAKQAKPRLCLQNLSEMVAPLPPEDIVVHLDLDDWLEDTSVLQRVYDAHAANAWLTYGSFTIASTGQFVRCLAYEPGAWRSDPVFRASHLKTFRAALFQAIPSEYLKVAGEWIPLCCDMAAMFPMLDMCGKPLRAAAFSDTPMVRYYSENSFVATASAEDRDRERYFARTIRAMKPLPPWSEFKSSHVNRSPSGERS